MTVDGRYSVLNRDNVRQPIQMELCQKKKKISGFVFEFLKGRLNFEHLQTKNAPHSWCVSEIMDAQIRG